MSLDGGATVLDTGMMPVSATLNQGWWSGTFANSDGNDNFFTGDPGGGDSLNNFFSFYIGGLMGPVMSADLILTRYTSVGLPLTYTIWDVTTDVGTLNFNDGVSAAIHADLGSGVNYGGVTVTGPLPDPLVVSLNAAGIADLNKAIADGKSYFSIGGTVSPGDVPEPSTMLLAGLAGIAAVVVRRRTV